MKTSNILMVLAMVPASFARMQDSSNGVLFVRDTNQESASATGTATATATATATVAATGTAAETATATTTQNAAPPPTVVEDAPPQDLMDLGATGAAVGESDAVTDAAVIKSSAKFATELIGGLFEGPIKQQRFSETLVEQVLDGVMDGVVVSHSSELQQNRDGNAVVVVVDAGTLMAFTSSTSFTTYLGLSDYQIVSKVQDGKATFSFFLPLDYTDVWFSVDGSSSPEAKISIFSGKEALGQIVFEFDSATRKRDATSVKLIHGSVPLTKEQGANFEKSNAFPEYVPVKGPTVKDYYICRKVAATTKFLDMKYRPLWETARGYKGVDYLETLRYGPGNPLDSEYDFASFQNYVKQVYYCLLRLPHEYNYFHDPNWKGYGGVSEWHRKKGDKHQNAWSGYGGDAPVTGYGDEQPAPGVPGAYGYGKPDPVAYGYDKPAATPAAAYGYSKPDPVAY
ncbi:hypothetical protein HDU77_009255, partial [Chytriomyces hyalinus]